MMELHVKCMWGKCICKWGKKKYCGVFDAQELICFFVMLKKILLTVLWQAVLTSLWHPNQIVYQMDPTTGCVH